MADENDLSNEEKIARDLVSDIKSQIQRLNSRKEKGSLKDNVDSELCSTVLPILLDVAELLSSATTITIDNAESISDIQEDAEEGAGGGVLDADYELFGTVFERFRFFLDQSLATELPDEVKAAIKENLELIKKAQGRLEEINGEGETTEEEESDEDSSDDSDDSGEGGVSGGDGSSGA